ncbi:amidohydrolase family protein [Acuticoccus sp. M5D2P5]|uniref:amidohydrolase family protein n=1 Tax=Acuticoccus kalidii TaxID=2910977 RepID=UPI001F31E389|nr:amidohydrolase family protein [Acuticoccus kalidii]MCF3933531.1 amidohydrolase family protein [Acuticoccus kalidii]
MAAFTAIRGATLVTLDEDDTVVEPGDLFIEGDRIAYAGPAGGFTPPEGAEVREIEGRDRVVMPGLVNCHTHSYAAFLKGSVDTDPLDVFMLGAILSAGARDARDVYVSAQVQALEMLLTGSTACLDHFSHRPRHSAEILDAVMSGYRDAGVRAAVAPMFSDIPFVETLPLTEEEMPAALRAELPSGPQPHDPYFEMMAEVAARWADDPRVDLMLGVDSPQRCTDALLRRAGAFCAEHGIGNHTHLMEAKTQWAMAEGRAPDGFVAYLADCGLAGPRSSFAHFVWFTDADLEKTAETGVHVVHNPASNLILGSGIQPLLRLIEAGVPVAFGSDGLNTGHMSMFEKTRLAALLTRVTDPDPDRWLKAPSALRMATVNGASALGRAGQAGVLAAGQLADIVILDGATVALSPRGEIAQQIVFYESGSSVRDVLVDGRHVLADGKPTGFDGAAILAEGRERAARLARDNQAALANAERYYPGLKAMVRRVVSSETGPCRIAMLT